jgi:hypothetical protein
MTVKFPYLALPLFVLLASCGGNAPADDERSASGEVLEGTISDEMLPLDRLRSEPPPANPRASAESRAASGGEASSEADEAQEATNEASGADAPGEAADTADE